MSSVEELCHSLIPPRARRLLRFRAYVDSCQYEGRPSFFASGRNAPPLLERAPAIVYPVAENAATSLASLAMGEGRFPKFSVPDYASDKTESVERLVREIVKSSELEVSADDLLTEMLSVGSCVAVCGFRHGLPFVESVEAEWCSPKFASDGSVESVEIAYPYIVENSDIPGSGGKHVQLYRRVLTTESDTVYAPAIVVNGTNISKISWVVENEVVHGFGFCPVVWGTSTKPVRGSFDGKPIHNKLLSEIDALNFAVSQRHRAALYTGDPQTYELGVSPQEAIEAKGGVTAVVADHDLGGFAKTQTRQRAQRKGPGTVWSYSNPDAKVGLLTLPGDALKTQDDNARDLKSKILESLRVVDIDIDNAKLASDTSGKALTVLHRRQIDACNKLRVRFGSVLTRIVSMFVAMAVALGDDETSLDCVGEARKILPNPTPPWWLSKKIELAWGQYFAATSAEVKSAMEMLKIGIDSGLVSKKAAVAYLHSLCPEIAGHEVLEEASSEPTVEQALSVLALGIGSPTFDVTYKARLAASLLRGCAPELVAQVVAEIEAGAVPVDGRRNIDAIESDILGPSSVAPIGGPVVVDDGE